MTVATFRPAHRAGAAGFGSSLVADLLLLVMAWVTAGAVAGSHWLPGTEKVIPVALVGLLVCGVLARVAPRGVTFWLATEVGLVVVLFVFTAGQPGDFVGWVRAVAQQLNLALLVSMLTWTWLSMAWTCYWVLRRGMVPIGIAPMAVVLGIEVINDPTQPALPFLVLAWIVLAGMLLLRHTATRLDRQWGSARGPELGSRLGIQGSRALAAMVVVAILLPPLTSIDLSTRFFTGGNQATGGLGSGSQRRVANPPFVQTGYSERVQPGGTLVRSQDPVLEVSTDISRTVYWRGIDLYSFKNGAWDVGDPGYVVADATAGQALTQDPYSARRNVHATVKVVGVAQNTVFWPGEPLHTSLPSQVRGVSANGAGTGVPLYTVDGAYAAKPVAPGATYTVDASVSVATEDQLRGAGTDYPAGGLAGDRFHANTSPNTIDSRIATLAAKVAGSLPTPYDQVKALETYLRTNLKYSLQVNAPPTTEDPVAYFLFQSHVGYCEYFASAMGEMVRSLNIPVRLVVGYGPGSPESQQDVPGGRARTAGTLPNLVHASDAHTWVEVFFPTYGWVPFEPTPDPNYPVISRAPLGSATQTLPPAALPNSTPQPTQARRATHPAAATTPIAMIAGLALLVLLISVLVVVLVARGPKRFRRPEAAWRRLGWLARRVGQPRRPSDTPIEFTTRLAAALPTLGPAITDLGDAYSQWCYRPAGIADVERQRADAAWRRVRRAIVLNLVLPRRRRLDEPLTPS